MAKRKSKSIIKTHQFRNKLLLNQWLMSLFGIDPLREGAKKRPFHKRLIVEYALTGYNKPIGVAQWERELTRSIPENLKSNLPTIEEIENELAGEFDNDE